MRTLALVLFFALTGCAETVSSGPNGANPPTAGASPAAADPSPAMDRHDVRTHAMVDRETRMFPAHTADFVDCARCRR